MSGECEKCHEHSLDCLCDFRICDSEKIIYELKKSINRINGIRINKIEEDTQMLLNQSKPDMIKNFEDLTEEEFLEQYDHHLQRMLPPECITKIHYESKGEQAMNDLVKQAQELDLGY